MVQTKKHIDLLHKVTASNVSYFRRAKELTRGDLAVRAGVSEMSLCRWERGSHLPSLANLVRLAVACGVPLPWYLMTRGQRKAIIATTTKDIG